MNSGINIINRIDSIESWTRGTGWIHPLQNIRIYSMSMIHVRLVIISSDKMGGRRAGYLEAALWRPRRLVELFPIIVFGAFFPKTVSKCSVTNSFIPKILIQSTRTSQIWKRTSTLILCCCGIRIHGTFFSTGSRIVGPCHFVPNLNDSAIMCRQCLLAWGWGTVSHRNSPSRYTNETQDDSQIDKKICETQIILN